jgi:hypothetical protein
MSAAKGAEIAAKGAEGDQEGTAGKNSNNSKLFGERGGAPSGTMGGEGGGDEGEGEAPRWLAALLAARQAPLLYALATEPRCRAALSVFKRVRVFLLLFLLFNLYVCIYFLKLYLYIQYIYKESLNR